MQWDKQAVERHERLPIPPNVSPFAKMQAEKMARNKGLDFVTVREVEEVEVVYADYFGREKTQEMQNLLAGKEPVPKMVEELFFDPAEKLYNIQVCPVKFGSQSKEVSDGILMIFQGIKEIFEAEHLEDTVADLSRFPLTQASRFSVVIDGCANCCEPPFFKDLGIIGQHIPEVADGECLQCNKCMGVCYEDAITLASDGPRIDRDRCINCEFCAKTCPSGKIVIGKRGYKVIAGGRDYRHPAIARVVKDFTNQEGVLAIVKKTVTILQQGSAGDTLKSLIEKHGLEVLY